MNAPTHQPFGIFGQLSPPLALGLLRLSTEGRPSLEEAIALIHLGIREWNSTPRHGRLVLPRQFGISLRRNASQNRPSIHGTVLKRRFVSLRRPDWLGPAANGFQTVHQSTFVKPSMQAYENSVLSNFSYCNCMPKIHGCHSKKHFLSSLSYRSPERFFTWDCVMSALPKFDKRLGTSRLHPFSASLTYWPVSRRRRARYCYPKNSASPSWHTDRWEDSRKLRN